MITYCKNSKFEKKIAKIKNITRVQLTEKYGDNVKCILADEKYRDLKETFPSEVNPCDPVVNNDDIKNNIVG